MKKNRVMVVEDDQDCINLYAEILSSEGFDVCKASDCVQALEQLNSLPLPDLIILDLTMPHMTAEQFMNLKRAQEKTKHIPVIIASARKDSEEVSKKLGAVSWISKPFDLENLVSQAKRFSKSNE